MALLGQLPELLADAKRALILFSIMNMRNDANIQSRTKKFEDLCRDFL